ncbi:hypothetical protein [uncultured Sphingomonas sp.]|uniref:hypothetical protein n=1 Tax=uncultured Sphingomonas sp. TaxID=158754 RepID=UPI0025E3B068|nr:hypothetical protein [uncultured Sphingomonas sp.]
MITTTLFALAIAATGSSDPSRGPVDALAAASATAVTSPQPTKAQKPTLYCLVDTVTGSRIPRKSCKTRVEWMAQGFDPLAAN